MLLTYSTRRTILCCLSALLLLIGTSCGEGGEKKSEPATKKTKPALQAEQAVEASQQKIILFFGNSLTAAYGLDPSEGFVSLIQTEMNKLDLPYKAVNAGLSGETTAGGNTRVDWILDQQKIDVFFLELGGNDGLRGIDPETSFKNLQSIIDKVKAKYPAVKIVLAGMEAPPNMGGDYTAAFRSIYQRLSQANDLLLMPFLLQDVGGVAALNQKDGIHPTAEGNQIIAKNIWSLIKPILQ